MRLLNFKHQKGLHCESTTLKDNLNYLGFSFSEAFVFGLDATMGFSFWDFEEKFAQEENVNNIIAIGGKQDWFHETSLACRILGVVAEQKTFQTNTEAWKDVIDHLDKQQAQMLQVDMGYLPFFKVGEFHFGGHFISAVGYENNPDRLLIVDNNFDEIQEVSREAIEKARSSKEGWKMLWPNRIRYNLRIREDKKRPPLEAAVKLAIQKVCGYMLTPSMAQFGISGIKRFIEAINRWPNLSQKDPNKFSNYLTLMYGYIEEYGTGGALFRNLYRDFISELLHLPELKTGPRAWNSSEIQILERSVPLIERSAVLWTSFAKEIQKLGSQKKILNQGIVSSLQQILDEICDIEKQFFSELNKIKL